MAGVEGPGGLLGPDQLNKHENGPAEGFGLPSDLGLKKEDLGPRWVFLAPKCRN